MLSIELENENSAGIYWYMLFVACLAYQYHHNVKKVKAISIECETFAGGKRYVSEKEPVYEKKNIVIELKKGQSGKRKIVKIPQNDLKKIVITAIPTRESKPLSGASQAKEQQQKNHVSKHTHTVKDDK
jgi:hypothetical protein